MVEQERKPEEQKKAYAPPTLTDHGKVEKETRGIAGDMWEVYGTRPSDENPN